MNKFVIKGSQEFANYAKNNEWNNSLLAGNSESYYYLIEDKKIIAHNYENTWDLPLLTLEDLQKKYTIEQLKGGNYIFDLNKEQHAKLESVGIDLCDFYGKKCYSSNGTHGQLEDYSKGQILVNFADIDFKEKEIIGYKCPQDFFGGKNIEVKKGVLFVKPREDYHWYTTKSNKNKGKPDCCFPEEIVETWEPVYKEVIKFKEVELGNPPRQFTIYKDKIKVLTGSGTFKEFDNKHLSILDSCLNKVLNKIDDYDIKVSAVQIGCVDGIELRIKDLNSIKEIQNDL